MIQRVVIKRFLILFTLFFVISLLQSEIYAGDDNERIGEQIKRGKTLVINGGCNTCHSPKVFTLEGQIPDPKRLLSGHPADSVHPRIPHDIIGTNKWGGFFTPDLTAWAVPSGVSFAANITPDKKTGIGDWTEDGFVKTIRTGRIKGVGRIILPPMPLHEFNQLSDDDLKAIFAYLMSLKPIENKVPEHMPPPDKPKINTND